jgi:phosphoribosylanthranilate isomerase
VFVKICGLTTREAVDAAVAAGADAVGFVFAPSPRRVAPEEAAALGEGLPAGVLKVAVTHHPGADLWQRVAEVFAPDWLQTDAEDLPGLTLGAGCQPLPVYRNWALPDERATPPRLLFEGPQSGSGRTADWQQARALAERCQLVLAGGLDPDNVERAIREVRPWGVDVSSGVESRPGRKDPRKIATFIARVRAAESSQ